MAETPITPFRLTADDIAAIDRAREHLGLRSRAETLRYVIREYLRAVAIDTRMYGDARGVTPDDVQRTTRRLRGDLKRVK